MKVTTPIMMLILALGLAAFATGCSPAHSQEPAAKPEAKPVNVKVQPAALTEFTEFITLSGHTAADKTVTYAAETPGRVEYLEADLGDRIKKGQVLARINYEMLKAQADQAQANYDLAEKTFNRFKTLRGEELASQQQIDEAESAMIQARAGLRIAKVNFDKSVVAAASDGIVARKFVEAGEYVGPGSPIFMLVDYRTIVIEAQAPETQVAAVKRGAPVKVKIDALNQDFDGVIHVVLPAADPLSRTFQVRVNVDNPDYQIMVGMAATLRIGARTHKDVVVFRQDVVIEEASQRSIFVDDNGIARKREVKLGPTTGDRVVLTEGVKEGDLVIVVGQRQLVDGHPVTAVTN
ncbi:MAG: efflux RND transporter periplasmic adaptor subunit [Myxococcales bacterium]|nr:MAG: efflux RND transporter periplasmic adaptor subunit [Myxococcales bacterium]